MENDRFRLLLVRKMANEITSAESKELDALLKNDKLKQLKYNTLINYKNTNSEESDLDELFSITMSKIALEDKQQTAQSQPKIVNSKNPKLEVSYWLRSSWKYAAVFSLIVISSIFYISYNKGIFEEDIQKVAAIEYITKSTSKGQKLLVTLPDGSSIKLNSNTLIKFRKDFNNKREVYLEGEAFFDVAENPEKPFTVNARGLLTTALGTSFNIRNFAEDEQVTVMLATGKVVVEDLKDTTNIHFLNPTEQLTYNTNNKQSTKSNFKMEWISWKDGTLYFENANIKQIKQQIELWYDVDVKLKGNINCSVNGSYTNKSLKHVLDGIKFSAGIAYEINDNEIILTGK
ncbi:MAG: hypothetical protein CMO01_26405 [Thalassobius sp.]|nr:hypothetical protein [Thalassovita sp.]